LKLNPNLILEGITGLTVVTRFSLFLGGRDSVQP